MTRSTGRRSTFALLALLCGPSLPQLASAHHSATEYDSRRIVEIAGTLSEVTWQNPHVLMKVTSVEGGTSTVYDIECNPLGTLERAGVNRKSLRVGDTVKVAGFVSRLSPTRLFGTNLLPSSGTELILALEVTPMWQKGAAATATSTPAGGSQAAAPPGLFKVWTSSLTDPDASPFALWRANPQLTPAAKASHASWDILRDSVAHGCDPQGMPTIMTQPLPMQFEDHGDSILLRIEEYDTVRTIHMTDVPAPAGKSLLGHSVGKWVGDVLVVNTTNISWPYISPDGLRLGRSARLQERFMPTADGRRLRYTLLIDDPDTFTVSPVLSRSWLWQDGVRVRDYACGRPQESPP